MRLGPLTPPGFHLRRSGIRWLREDGATVRAGEAVAFCNVGLAPLGAPSPGAAPFAEEWLDVQAVMAPRVGGVLRRAEASSRGGFLDQLDHFQLWTPEFAIGAIEPESGPTLSGPADEVALFMTAARRQADLAEGRQGVLTGWHDRVRAWRAEGEGAPGCVISLGLCEVTGVIRGEQLAFLELFEQVSGPVHAIQVADEPLVHGAVILAELGARTDAEREAIADDLVEHLTRSKARPAEWIFAGAILTALHRAPLGESYDLLGRSGLRRTDTPDAVVLSASAERGLRRHRRLGYAINVHGFRAMRAGPAVSAWLQQSFEPVPQSIDQIAREYRALLAAIRAARGPKHVLIVNLMSTSGEDEIQDYRAFDAPMADTLGDVRARDMNLMLQDLAREQPEVEVLDLDAITAEMGGQRNLPDGMHSSGALQTELRGEMLRILRQRGVPGFGPPRFS